MTRDMELVRKILFALSATERPLDSVMVRINGYAPEQIVEHIRQLHEARLLDGSPVMGSDRRLRWNEMRLTWRGHDFIECARSEPIWRMAQETLGPDSASTSLEEWRRKMIEIALRLVRNDGVSG